MNDWLILQTGPRREVVVYSAIIDMMQADFAAWIPHERKWTRIAHTRRQYREWLAPVLPGRIFACIPQWLDMSVFGLDEEGQPRTKIMRDAEFKAILVADEQIDRFRRELEIENLERLYAARKPLERGPAAQAIWQLGQPRKPLVGHRKPKKSRSIKARAA